MNTPLSLLCGVSLALTTVSAQIVPGGVPFVHDTAGRLTAAYDHNGDGRTDVVSLLKEQGSFSLGLRQADGSFVWSTPRSVGFAPVEAMAVGRFISPSEFSIAVTSRRFNNVQLVPLDGADLPPPFKSYLPPEPSGLATLPLSSGTHALTASFTAVGVDAEPLKMLRHDTPFGLWSCYEAAPNARRGATLYTKAGSPPVLAFAADLLTPGTALVQFFEADENAASLLSEWLTSPALPEAVQFTQGFFQPDVTAQGGGYQSTTLLAWTPGSPTLRIARLTNGDLPNSSPLPGTEIFPPAARSFNMQRPIRCVYVLLEPGASTRLLITWADAAGGASIHRFDGDAVPDLVEGLGLNNLIPDGFAPLAGGDFIALGQRNGQPAHDVYTESTPGHYTALHTGAFPTLPDKALYSNVVAFRGEPMVDSDARALKRARVADWSTAGTPPAAPGGETASITSLTDTGRTTGLGSPASSSLSVPPATSDLLLNQLGPHASMAFVSARTADQSTLPQVVFQPSPGLYPSLEPGESLAVRMSSPGGGFDVSLLYSVNGGVWMNGSRFEPVMITGNTTIRAYAFSYLSGTGPIVTATYTFGSVPAPAVQSTPDADMNGLSDSWEDLTGIHDPAGDADGDGFLNLAEHNAGFDPNDPLSKPDAVAVAPTLQLQQALAGVPALRWDANDTAILLETSADLENWTLVTHGTRIEGSERVFDLPVNSFPRRFYRLRR